MPNRRDLKIDVPLSGRALSSIRDEREHNTEVTAGKFVRHDSVNARPFSNILAWHPFIVTFCPSREQG